MINSFTVLSHHRTYRSVYGGSLEISYLCIHFCCFFCYQTPKEYWALFHYLRLPAFHPENSLHEKLSAFLVFLSSSSNFSKPPNVQPFDCCINLLWRLLTSDSSALHHCMSCCLKIHFTTYLSDLPR